MNRIVLVMAILLVLIYPAQSIHISDSDIGSIDVRAPWPTQEWSRATPEELGMNPEELEAMTEYFSTNKVQVDSILIIRNGWLVFEEYSSKYGPDKIHHLFSCTKSITSTLVGIASYLEYLESIETPVLDFFPETNFNNPSETKDSISIKNLLEMTTGLEWNEEQYGHDINDYNKMIRSEDWVKYVLDKPMVTEPGTAFLYNSGASHILSAIIQQVTHNSTLDFAVTNLFQLLGISDYEWDQDPQGIYSGASSLKMRPIDMGKIGYLYLRDGLWDGVQVIPQDWVQSTLTSQIQVDESLDYSYQWWILSELGAYFALGWGYQSITVVPDYDLVIVVTAATLDPSAQVEQILNRWIFPSLGLNTTIHTSFTISPLIILIGGSPFIVMAIAYFMDLRGFWNEIEREKKETD